jgi:hypothetical protein
MKRLQITVPLNRAGRPVWARISAKIEDEPKSQRVRRLPKTGPGRFFHGSKTPDLSASRTHRAMNRSA